MRIVAAIFADFRESFLGGASPLSESLAGASILAHTLRRAARIEGVFPRVIVTREPDRDAAVAAIRESAVEATFDVLALPELPRPRRSLVRSARRWNLDAWRGTPLGTTYFDEFVEPPLAAAVLRHCGGEAILCLDGCMPALDAAIASRMASHARESGDDAKLVFTQAPPGIAGVILRADLLQELLERQAIVGHVLAYHPDAPRMDLITRPPCCRIDAEVAQTPQRLVGDTQRSRRRLASAFAALGADADAGAICEFLAARDEPDPLPAEIEIELGTDDPLPETMLRPRGQRVPRRGPVELSHVERVGRELASMDDRRIVLAGFGDPLAHPRFADACGALRGAGALAVATPLVDPPDTAIEVLFRDRVDVLEVLLDADSRETYARVHGADAFDRVIAAIERVRALRVERAAPQPIIIPSLTRCRPTLGELERFYDRWLRATGSAAIRGYGAFGGVLPADDLLDTTPLIREPCRRLASRLTLLADGQAVACDQDHRGEIVLGDWTRQTLAEIWAGGRRAQLLAAHRALEFARFAPCRSCRQWHVV